MKKTKLLLSIFSMVVLCFGAQAEKYIGEKSTKPKGQGGANPSKAAACAPSTGQRDLEYNNVRALIETGGSMWQDRSTSRARYVVPKEGNVSAIYAGSLWMGGLSPDQQLKLAAIRFRTEGNDYWPGPLTNDGAAEVNSDVCNQYDRFWVTERIMTERHFAYFQCLNDPNCDLTEQFPDGYVTPSVFFEWPAHGNTALSQDYYIAPFFDYDGDLEYDPTAGDAPGYDILGQIDCKTRSRTSPIPLFGDHNFWWVFNDKGNVHSESNGQPIGMEIRAQAFAFATTDEVNNMTFYNYTVINQGTQTLTNTYFGQWVDPDLGTSIDDYVGCDVQRGLGYCYNGDADDQSSTSSPGYGLNPPAVGIDFFEGPYQDADGVDNPLTTNIGDALEQLGIPYKGIGIGYGDDVIDNERFGMRRFVYYNNNSAINGEPNTALDYYNYLRGIWKNGQQMGFGGDGLNPGTGTDLSIPADYMFPGDTDPFYWGTHGVPTPLWTEQTAGNQPADRRFIQAAGPFTLEPGDYNNVTVGVVYARATGGDPFESVKLVQIADDKAQALFDNCFVIPPGPDAPDLTIVEMENELVLYWTNDNSISNNYLESRYDSELEGFDPIIPEVYNGAALDSAARSYLFQGYLVYQLAADNVSVSEIDDINKARLIFQCDIEDFDAQGNPIANLINYELDPIMNLPVPKLMVEGANKGVKHSISVKEDQFAVGDKRLVNYKTYYFMVIAYGYNNYGTFDPTTGLGQDIQFRQSRKAALGSIAPVAGIPHPNASQSGGLILNARYGDGVSITKHEGFGNGINALDITDATRDAIFANNVVSSVTYEAGRGPVDIKVVDPLRIPAGDYELRLNPENLPYSNDAVRWVLTNLENPEDKYTSRKAFKLINEELLVDLGLSIDFSQYFYTNNNRYTKPVENESSITFADPNRPWLRGIPDDEGFSELNWIRSGTLESEDAPDNLFNDYADAFDLEENWEGIIDGTWAPFRTVSQSAEDEATGVVINVAPSGQLIQGLPSHISQTPNVDVIITKDKSKWTRVPVLEMQSRQGLIQNTIGSPTSSLSKMRVRRHKSVDKNGRTEDDPGVNLAEANLTGSIGMGWFPGYAIDVGTGERLNMAFGEDSWFGSQNGRDMLWNPGSQIENTTGEILAGGQHWVYVFFNDRNQSGNADRVPAYDEAAYIYSNIETNFSANNMRKVFRACGWVGSALHNPQFPMLSVEQGLIPNDVKIRLRVAKTYAKWSPTQVDVGNTADAQNNWNPLYTFSTRNLAPVPNDATTLESSLDRINVVPNPYYAFSGYETSKLDNRIKIINLPEECTISIYSLNGALIRQFKKASPETYQDWDLKNMRNIPVSSGVYLIHVNVPGAGEKVLKWFGVMRPTDLDNF